MARRKRRDDEPDWEPPEFDEVGYMRQEIQGAHAAIATIGWSLIGAIVGLLLYAIFPPLAFFAGIAVGFGMYFLFPLVGIKTDAFKRRDWIGHGATYFFSWLAFWILLLNPPFSDHTPPTIQSISVSAYTPPLTPNTTLGCLSTDVVGDPSRGLPMGTNNAIYVLFRATDNAGPPNVSVEVVPGPTPPVGYPAPVVGANHCAGHQQEQYLGGTYAASFLQSASSYLVTIKASDSSGNSAQVSFTIYPK